MKIQSMEDLFVHELGDLYNAEKQILKALPKMVKAATATELKMALEEHLEATKGQMERLEQIFEELDRSAPRVKCKGMEGLLEEGDDLVSEEIDPEVLDAGIIGAAQKVEHYEIAGYGTARAFAELLGHQEAAQLLGQTLEEEEEADKKLTRIAEGRLNARAERGGTSLS